MCTHDCPPRGAPTTGATAACLQKMQPLNPSVGPSLCLPSVAYMSCLPVLIHSTGIALASIIALESQYPHSSCTPVNSWKVPPQTPFQSKKFAKSLKQGSVFQGKLRDVVPARPCKACPLRMSCGLQALRCPLDCCWRPSLWLMNPSK